MRFNSQIGVAASVAAGVAAMSIAANACAQTAVEWRVQDGGNGHWYRRLGEFRNWPSAKARCEQLGGHLASLTSSAEWSWAINATGITEGYVGAFQDHSAADYSEPNGGWRWVTGEPFVVSGSYMMGFDDCPGAAPPSCNCGAGAQDALFIMGCCSHMLNDNQDGTSVDCDMGVNLPFPPVDSLIEWSADCNNDGLIDYGQILAGDLSDANANNIPDCCETVFVCWGDNSNQQCTPPKGAFAPIGIASGYNHSVALLADGTVVGWGSNVSGQCDVPTSVFAPRQIAAGDSHSMALIADGSVRCWGRTVEGQCTIPSAAQNVVLISAGGNHSLAVVADRTLLAWGWNNYGQSTVPASLTSVALVEAGVYHTAVVTTSGSVVCFGLDDYGQCTPPSFPSTPIAVSAGDRHTAALLPDGTIRCWGQNSFGQCSPPKSLPLLTAIATSDRYTMGLSSSGEVFQWGSVPAAVPAGIGEVTVIAAGAYHVVAAVSAPPCPRAACAGDIVIDGAVNGIDLAAVLSLWGTSGGALDADVNNDGAVDAQDLAIVLSAWGACE